MPDAVLFSGWRWDTFNTPERIALALACAGAKVLYCENPASRFKASNAPAAEISPGVFGFKPLLFGHRLNNVPILSRLQCSALARQVVAQAQSLQLHDPIFVYQHLKNLTPLLSEIKSRRFRMVHLCIDAPESYQWEQIELSDLVLTIPPTIHELLNQRYPGKSHLVPQPFYSALNDSPSLPEPEYLSSIPHPRFAYLGPAFNRLDVPLIESVFRAHPDWHFLTFGANPPSSLPNIHRISWCDWKDIPRITSHIDAGFMPYNCSLEFNRHCVPLKLFDYFAAGLPVVSTPILYAQRYPELLTLAGTSESVSNALGAALSEPANSPLKPQRRALAAAHAIPIVAERLRAILFAPQSAGGLAPKADPAANSFGASR